MQHHFGTKEALIHASDDYMLSYLREQVTAGVTDHGMDKPEFVERVHRTAPPLMKYLAAPSWAASPRPPRCSTSSSG